MKYLIIKKHGLELPVIFSEIESHDEVAKKLNVLSDLVPMNAVNRHVFVHDQDGDIMAFLMFDDNDTFFHIEFVAVNRLVQSQTSGTKLILLLEELGKTLNYTSIELYSLEQKIQYYESLGFTDTGIPQVGHYGKMSKMKKSLN